MWKDPIVEEIHQVREKIAQEHDYDIYKLFEYYRGKETEHGGKVVTRPPQRPDAKQAVGE